MHALEMREQVVAHAVLDLPLRVEEEVAVHRAERLLQDARSDHQEGQAQDLLARRAPPELVDDLADEARRDDRDEGLADDEHAGDGQLHAEQG